MNETHSTSQSELSKLIDELLTETFRTAEIFERVSKVSEKVKHIPESVPTPKLAGDVLAPPAEGHLAALEELVYKAKRNNNKMKDVVEHLERTLG